MLVLVLRKKNEDKRSMPLIAQTTSTLQSLAQTENNGTIQLMRFGEHFPDIWEFISKNYHYKPWLALEIDEDSLASALSNITAAGIREHVDRAEGMDFFGRLKECEHVENDRLFKWDIKYVMAFVKMLSETEGLGSPQAMWEVWHRSNAKAMEHNLAPQGTSQTAAGAAMLSHNVSLDEARKIIMEGAEYRCKRNYAAFVRELYVLASLASGNEDYAGMRVFWHPLWDMACKCDAVVVPENSQKMGIVGLGVYLKSRRSNYYASVKGGGMPPVYTQAMHHILSLAIPIERGAYQSGKIILPRETQLDHLRCALNGNRASMFQLGGAYYSENHELMAEGAAV